MKDYNDILHVEKIINEELGIEPPKTIRPNDKLSDLEAQDVDYINIFERIGLKPFPKYFNVAADKLTEEGETVYRKIMGKISVGVRKTHDNGLQAMMQNLNARDIFVMHNLIKYEGLNKL